MSKYKSSICDSINTTSIICYSHRDVQLTPSLFCFFWQTGIFLFSVNLFWLFCHNTVIHQWDRTRRSGERALLSHCFTAVCRAEAHNASLNGSRKEVDGPLCLKGTRNSAAYEASLRRRGGGSLFFLICCASQHKSQVAGLLDHCTMRSTWTVREGGGREQRWDRKERGGQGGSVCYDNSFGDTVTCFFTPQWFSSLPSED